MTGNLLLSYWYTRKADLDRILEPHSGAAIFADSGAYSAMTTGADIDIHDYAQWLIRWKHRFTVYSNLDVVGDPLATARNQAILEDRYGLEPLPVFHVGEPWEWLDRYANDHKYIALGGMAKREYNNGKRVLMPWLIRCFQVAEGRSRFHGFGQTDWEAISVLPWASVDSTTWLVPSRFGRLLVFGNGKLWQFDRSLIRRNLKHLNDLGFSYGEAVSATRGDAQMGRRIAIAAVTAAESHLQRKFKSDMRIYLAGLL